MGRWTWIASLAEPELLAALVAVVGLPLLLLPWPAGPALSAVGAALVLWANHRLEDSVRRLPARVGVEAMRGQTAVVVEPLDPRGTVRVGGEVWRAVEAHGRRLGAGQAVRVVRVRGLELAVEARTPQAR